MAEENKKACSEKKWVDYDQKSLLMYLLQNNDEMDCSFIIKDPQNDTQKVLISFQWMLSEISPYWKRMFSEEEKEEGDFEFDIDDPNFEQILAYTHTKILQNRPFKELLSLYDSSRNYQIEPLMATILSMIQVDMLENWIGLFKLAYEMKKSDQQLFYAFNKVMKTLKLKDIEEGLQKNMAETLSFEFDVFYDFLSFLKAMGVQSSLCLKTAEIYFSKKLNNKLLSNNLSQDIKNLYLENIGTFQMDTNDLSIASPKKTLSEEHGKKEQDGSFQLDTNDLSLASSEENQHDEQEQEDYELIN